MMNEFKMITTTSVEAVSRWKLYLGKLSLFISYFVAFTTFDSLLCHILLTNFCIIYKK